MYAILGRMDYARALVDIRVGRALKDTMMILVPFPVFCYDDTQCPKRVIADLRNLRKQGGMSNDGFQIIQRNDDRGHLVSKMRREWVNLLSNAIGEMVLYDARERSEVCMHDLNLSPGNIGTPPLAGSRELHLHLPYGMLHPQQEKKCRRDYMNFYRLSHSKLVDIEKVAVCSSLRSLKPKFTIESRSINLIRTPNIRVILLTVKMEILLESTSNKLMLERFYTSAGNPVKEILLKLNLPNHRILKDGGEEMLKKFGLEESKPMKTPMSSDTKLTKDEECESVDSTKYRGMIGDRIETVVYADSDHARDYVDQKRTSGIYTFVGCCLTSWFSKKQNALATSTTEAEYVSAGKACQQALWMKQALIDYDVRLDGVRIMCDNKGTIDLSKNPLQHSRTKHIEIRHHFLRDNVQKGHISIEKLSSVDNIADILTKPLKRELFNYLHLEFAQILDIPYEGACVFTDKWLLNELAYGVPRDDPYQTNPPSTDDIISESPELVNEPYVLYDRVLNPLTAQQERTTRKDCGTRRGRHSTSSSSAFDQPSSSHLNDDDDDDDDGNDKGTSRTSTPSPTCFVNSLTNELNKLSFPLFLSFSSSLNPPTMDSTQASSSNPSKKIKLTIIPPRKLFVNISSDEDVTTTYSPIITSSSLSLPNAPSKTPSTKDTLSTFGTTSFSFESKPQSSPPTSNDTPSSQPSNPFLENFIDVPLRPSHPLPLQSHHSLDITLSLSLITLFDHILDTPSTPLP
ncbi:hypothetical protein Tco_0409670 [Tanacetum coccineum]